MANGDVGATSTVTLPLEQEPEKCLNCGGKLEDIKGFVVGDVEDLRRVICLDCGYHDENRSPEVLVPVVRLEELLLLKLIPEGRDKDTVDVVSLILDNGGTFDGKLFAQLCASAGLGERILKRIDGLLLSIKRGETRKDWQGLTGKRFEAAREKHLVNFLKRLKEVLA